VTTAGTYTLSGCVASPNGPGKWHFEYPVGTKIGATLSVTNTSAYNIFAYQNATTTVALPAGTITVRVVIEASGMNFGGLSYH
jgi:hypothetical protein